MTRHSGDPLLALLLLAGLSTSGANAANDAPTKKAQQDKCEAHYRECLDWCAISKSYTASAAADPTFLQSCRLGCSRPWLNCISSINVQGPAAANEPEVTPQSKRTTQPNRRLRRTPPEKSLTKTDVDAGGAHWAIQLASVRNPSEVKAEWRRLHLKFKSILSGKKLAVARVHLGARGIFFRLRIGGFQNKSSAATTCASIKSAGGECLVVFIPQ